MRRLGTFLFRGAIVLVAFGCNSILENEPGRLDRGASASRENGGASGASGGSSGSSSGDGSEASEGAAPISGDSRNDGGAAPAPEAGACTPGMKACGGLCVSTEDPFFGCADPTCARCAPANATAACVLGACGVASCAPDFADCNGLPADGCEASLQTVNDCGGCGLRCPNLDNAQMACVGGACTGTCLPGFGDCNGEVADGCERNLLNNRNHCGACGVRCVFGKCEQGTCVWGSGDDDD